MNSTTLRTLAVATLLSPFAFALAMLFARFA